MANVLAQPEDFSGTSPWSDAETTGVVVTNATTAPDGTSTADHLQDLNGFNSRHNIRQLLLGASSVGTASIFAKKQYYDYLGFQAVTPNSNPGGFFGTLNLNNGLIYVSSKYSTVTSYSERFANGWWRIVVTGLPSDISYFMMDIGPCDTQYFDTQHVGVTGRGIYVWGAWANVGAPEAYISQDNWNSDEHVIICGDLLGTTRIRNRWGLHR